MECKEERVNLRDDLSPEDALKEMDLLFEFNNNPPSSEKHISALKKLMGNRLGEGSILRQPLNLVSSENFKVGRNVFIGINFLGMCRGGITIEDDVMIAANTSILSNNHDLYDRSVLLCKPVIICKGAWIGANFTILPGVRIGRYAVVGAGSVVTKDVGDYQVAVGNPARVVKELDAERFKE